MGCLKKDGLGNIQFDFGGDVMQKLEDLLTIDESELRVRMNEASLTSKREETGHNSITTRNPEEKETYNVNTNVSREINLVSYI